MTAHWVLFDAGGKQLARYVFVGLHSDGITFGGRKAHIEKAQMRALAALEELFEKTVIGLSQAPEMARLKTGKQVR